MEGATVESEAGDLERLEKDSLMSGMSSVLPPDGMTEEQAVQVYNNYNFSHKYDPGMSITKYQEEVCVLLTYSFDSYTDTICSTLFFGIEEEVTGREVPDECIHITLVR